MDARHLPANWSSTSNALEGLAFTAKDALLVVDDFCPTGSVADVQRYHKEADRLFRGQGNRAGRQRMRADATLRPAKPPRGLMLSTGEETPRGQSLRARLLVLEISPGDFGPQPPRPNPTLSACQQDGAAAKYATALAGFIRWLAPQVEDIRGRLRAELAELRDQVSGDGQHARTPGIVADLALGLRYLLDFALAVRAVSEKGRGELWQRGWAALAKAAEAQAAHIASAEPAGLFVRLLAASLASGRAHIAGPDGSAPKEPERWGWRLRTTGAGENARDEWHAQGHLIGWIDGENLYLEPDGAHATAQRLAVEQGESLPVTQETLRRRLKEKGLLASTDERRQKLTVRRTLQGSRRDVLHLALTPDSPLCDTGPTGPEAGNLQENGPVSRACSWAGNGEKNGELAHEKAGKGAANGSVGRLGQSDRGEGATAGEGNSERQANGWGDWQ
jgi:hypothetical protein